MLLPVRDSLYYHSQPVMMGFDRKQPFLTICYHFRTKRPFQDIDIWKWVSEYRMFVLNSWSWQPFNSLQGNNNAEFP
jgi:hypothetical protein